MIELIAEKTLNRYLVIGVPLASAFLWASGTTDPVNVTKLFITGGVAAAAGVTAILFFWKRIWRRFSIFVLALFFFLAAMINSLFRGQGPFLQNYYGAYGRQTGFLTFFLLTLLLISVLAIQERRFFSNILRGLIFVGILNILYCAWVLAFGDFLPWNNVYKSILGLFGNPDFISAFLGIYITVCISLVFETGSKLNYRIFLVGSSILAFYEIVKSHAIQGIVVTAGGLVVIGFFLIRSKAKSWALPSFYALSASALGFLAILGTLQTGPLSFIYKRSVSLRGSYWQAGLGMGEKYPTAGVGFDGYGDFYRQTRPPAALIDLPGVQVVSNISHNVYIDFFAFGGWPLLAGYVVINIFVVVAILNYMRKNTKYDATFVGLTTAWLCYQVQSIISINQIGLAIWGWVFSGAILSYTALNVVHEPASTDKTPNKRMNNSRTQVRGSVVTPQLVAGISCLVGLILAFPPLGSDLKWKSALESRNLAQIESSLNDSYFNPVPSSRFVMAYQIFGNSKLPEFALKYARIITNSNPNYFEGWRALYLLPNSTEAEKKIAAANLRRLDPLNPDVLSPTP